eukprot:TRINITY_DN2785_c0_g1_i1.p1 TRINITY_DN2785_c0_g1~~TRINITY_DN2785_c0_g1_i1.p1  ORF type:complete len:630 (-),score=161.15 TRINITY_DN2785_c0_g1_i1:80-1969(-)
MSLNNLESRLPLWVSSPSRETKTVVISLLGAFLLYKTFKYIKDKRSRIVLELDLEHKKLVWDSISSISLIFRPDEISVRDIVDALDIASEDSRVVGIVIRIGGSSIQLSYAQELRSAIQRFRAHGKQAICFSETFGEMSPSQINYYVASSCSKIYLSESGDLNLVGLFVVQPFFKKTLEKLGIQPQLFQREQYKNACNMFNQEDFTEAHRESAESMVSGIFDILLSDIAKDRSIPIEEMRRIFADGPHTAKNSLDLKLIDGVMYRDEVIKTVKDTLKPTQFMYLRGYLKQTIKKRPFTSGKNIIAFINAEGMIHRGKSEIDPVTGGSDSIGSDVLCAALRAATINPKVKAIVLRIDSGGGSYIASDNIAREMIVAREAGKKVVVYMANVAASGGYFVSQNADQIVCQPLTLTGSIGVFLGKMVLSDLANKLGITFGFLPQSEEHQSARAFSSVVKYNEEEEKKMNATADRIYSDFKAKVARGRHLEPATVDSLAKGRVWVGHQAHSHHLVDHLGDFRFAVELAARECNIDAKTVRLERYPKTSLLLEIIGSKSSEDADKSGILPRTFAGIFASVRSLASLGSALSMALPLLAKSGLLAQIQAGNGPNLTAAQMEVGIGSAGTSISGISL